MVIFVLVFYSVYPMQCLALSTLQKQNNTASTHHDAPITRIMFSRMISKQNSIMLAPLCTHSLTYVYVLICTADASRLLTASLDSTAKLCKLPFSKFRGDGIQLVGMRLGTALCYIYIYIYILHSPLKDYTKTHK